MERDHQERLGLVDVIGPECSCAPEWSYSDIHYISTTVHIHCRSIGALVSLYIKRISTIIPICMSSFIYYD